MSPDAPHGQLFAGHKTPSLSGELLSTGEERIAFQEWAERRLEFVRRTVFGTLSADPSLNVLEPGYVEVLVDLPMRVLQERLEAHESTVESAAAELEVPTTTSIDEVVARRSQSETERRRVNRCIQPIQELSLLADTVLTMIAGDSAISPERKLQSIRTKRSTVVAQLQVLKEFDKELAERLTSAFSPIFDKAQRMRTPFFGVSIRRAFAGILNRSIGASDQQSTVHTILVSLQSKSLLNELLDRRTALGRQTTSASEFTDRTKLVRGYRAALEASRAALLRLADDDPERVTRFFGARPRDSAQLDDWLNASDPRHALVAMEREYFPVNLNDGDEATRELSAALERYKPEKVIGLLESRTDVWFGR